VALIYQPYRDDLRAAIDRLAGIGVHPAPQLKDGLFDLRWRYTKARIRNWLWTVTQPMFLKL
jgi:hypothetical protein